MHVDTKTIDLIFSLLRVSFRYEPEYYRFADVSRDQADRVFNIL